MTDNFGNPNPLTEWNITPVEYSFLQNEENQQRLENQHYDLLERYLLGNINIKIPKIVRDEISQREVVTNFLRPVLESYVHMLGIKSITASEAALQPQVDEYLENIGFDTLEHEIYSTAGLFGRCYLQLLYNKEADLIDIIVLDPRNIRKNVDAENINITTSVIKTWLDLDFNGRPIERVEKYYPDRIESYFTPAGERFPIPYLDGETPSVRPNPAGFIPIFEIKNRGGISEIENGIGIQDSINQWLLEAMESGLFKASGQIYIIGVDTEITEKEVKKSDDTGPTIVKGLGRKPYDVWTLGPEVKTVGKITGEDIGQFFTAVDKRIEHLAIITATSISYLQTTSVQTGAGVVALQRAETDKVRASQKAFSNQLKKILKQALLLSGIITKVDIEWEDPAQFGNKIDDLKEFQAGLLSIQDYHSRQGVPALKIASIIANIKQEQADGLLKNVAKAATPTTGVQSYGNEALVPQVAELPAVNPDNGSDAGVA